jgi:hypothetical protein
LFVLALVTGCYASHEREVDGGSACTFSFAGRGGEVACRIEHPGAACTDAARCVCIDRLGGAPTEAELDECVRAERMPRALITFSDFCAPTVDGNDMREALEGYFRFEGEATVALGCASIPARF